MGALKKANSGEIAKRKLKATATMRTNPRDGGLQVPVA